MLAVGPIYGLCMAKTVPRTGNDKKQGKSLKEKRTAKAAKKAGKGKSST